MAQFVRLRNPLVIVLLLIGAVRVPAQSRAAEIELRPGLVITRSVKVARRTYRLTPDMPNDSGAIVIRGNDITVDLGGATIEGMPIGGDPDLASGIAIRVDGGKNIRIVNGRVRGYKIGILARGTTNLTIDNIDASNNWKPRLFSLVEHESLVDWLSFHHNEKDEWYRFGAAFLLQDVSGGRVHGSRAEQGMNALLMVRTNGMQVEDNDFSYNSGLGIGLYRSSHNTIVRNRVDFDVRGYSHGFYRRGQDSSGILLYEQSSDNVIAYNSGTHGGDGFFLWAGQQTMDSGEGGANDNWLIGNDFSWAPANGIEATFSRNSFIANRLEGNDYGIWGGYSYSSLASANCFVNNRIGIAIEHGQDNAITGNAFHGDTTAISLWANPIEPSDWAYPKKRDTKSRDYIIDRNTMERNRVALRAVNTGPVTFQRNRLSMVDSINVLRDTSRFMVNGNVQAPPSDRAVRADPCVRTPSLTGVPDAIRRRATVGAAKVPLQPLARRDRSAIIVDEWGPYDWKSPKLWPLDSSRALPLRLRVVGPPGRWRVQRERGIVRLSRGSGVIGDTIIVTPALDSMSDWSLELEYTGGPTRSPRGQGFGAGARTTFSYDRFEPRLDWTVKFFVWSDTTKGSGPPTRALAGVPMVTRKEPRLDYFWSRPLIKELPRARWALDAASTVDLSPGDYTLQVISDDGARVWVDGRLVIDHWDAHESTVDHAALTGGRHDLRVQYYQVDGWTEFRLDVVRGMVRSKGSAGPH